VRVIIGSAQTQYPGWISTNRDTLDLLCPEDWRAFAPVEMALAEHVWEHLTPEDGQQAAINCVAHVPRLRVAVPDGNFPDAAYVARARLGECVGDHQALYTLPTLTAIFLAAGYGVTPLEWWDEWGEFHYRPWSPDAGMVMRSLRFDKRNRGTIGYTSLIIDCWRGM